MSKNTSRCLIYTFEDIEGDPYLKLITLLSSKKTSFEFIIAFVLNRIKDM